MRTLIGRCLCGAVEFAVADCFEYALNCHCSQCRRATGAAFKPLAGVRMNHLRINHGTASTLVHGAADAARDIHCSTCGSLLYSVVREGAYAHVAMGTLVDTPSIRPSMHIFVGSKATWFEITDDLPQFDTNPDP